MKKKIIRITTVDISWKLLKGQLKFLNDHYEIVGISSKGNELIKASQEEGIFIKAIEMQRRISPVKDFISLLKIYFFLKKESPLIIHSITPKAGLISMIAGKMAGVPIRMHTFTGLIFPTKTGIYKKILILSDKLLCFCATNVYPEGIGVKNDLYNNKVTTKELKVLGNGNVNGIDLSYFNADLFTIETKLQLREHLKLSHQDFVFIFVGRLVGDKGINELIAAFKEILNEHKDVQLLLVGNPEENLDPMLQETKDFIFKSDKIIATGWVDDVRPYFAISNCLTFPSYREGFPNVVMQAGAMGLYSIVSNINGCNEIIKNGTNGTIIPAKNTKALYKAMKHVLENRRKFSEGKNLYRNMIQTRYEQEFVWNELLKEYRNLESAKD